MDTQTLEEIQIAWGKEVDRIVQGVRDGSISTIPWEQARAHIFRDGNESGDRLEEVLAERAKLEGERER